MLDRDFVLNEDIYSGKSGLQILDALNATLFDEMGFIGNSANYYNPANSYIDQVRLVKYKVFRISRINVT